MIHLKNYELFLESAGNRKYEIVTFNQNFTIENIYGGEDTLVNINIKKGERVKLFFDNKNSSDDKYTINAIRPVEASQNESKKLKKETVELNELWEANFILSPPIIINKTNSPFDIESYL